MAGVWANLLDAIRKLWLTVEITEEAPVNRQWVPNIAGQTVLLFATGIAAAAFPRQFFLSPMSRGSEWGCGLVASGRTI